MEKRLFSVALVISAMMVAGCSGGKSAPNIASLTTPASSAGNSGSGAGSQAAFEACLREHGVQATAQPGGVVELPVGGDKALQACQSLAPQSQPRQSQQSNDDFKKAQLKTAACMRAHGIPYPDPSFSADGGGVSIALPDGVDQSSPKYQAAWKVCQPAGLGDGGGMVSATASDAPNPASS
jgi:hypothetical protein